jgi:hypothetical protein
MFTGKLADVTGPDLTERWGVTSTDLGASTLAPNGKLVSVFGDTFSGRSVGQGDWRSPVQRDKGIILRRVRPEDIGNMSTYVAWRFAGGQWEWGGGDPTPITPGGETWGELTFRRQGKGSWILGGFLSSKYALAYRVVDSPVANMHTTPIQMPIIGSGWADKDHEASKVAQLYGGYVLPGSRFDVVGGCGLVVSQWNTTTGWPYRAMQFTASLKDTTRATDPANPINL